MPCLKEALNYLYSLERGGIKPGLKRVKRLLSLLDNPHRGLKSILVAGTNGKGSTAAMIAAILREAGYRVGLYTSPHLLRFNERLCIDGKPIADRELAGLITMLKKRLEADSPQDSPTFFEFATAIAFRYFKDRAVDMAVVEVGMGGRYDATNVLHPEVAVITTIGYDHTDYLGDTIEEIAGEKAGIIKDGSKVVTAVEDGAALGVIEAVAKARAASLYRYGREFQVEWAANGELFYRGDTELDGLRPALKGRFQLANLGCALKAIEILRKAGYRIGVEDIRAGLGWVEWPARFQLIDGTPRVLLDCAHNPQGAAALAEEIGRLGYKRLIMVVGMLKDKPIDAIMGLFAGVASLLVCTEPDHWRSADPYLLKSLAEGYGRYATVKSPVAQAVAEALNRAGADDLLCVTGSIFTVAEAIEYLQHRGYRVMG